REPERWSIRIVLDPLGSRVPMDLDRRDISPRATGGHRRERHGPDEPRPLSRQAGPLDGAGCLRQPARPALGLPHTARPALLALAAGRPDRPRGTTHARRG